MTDFEILVDTSADLEKDLQEKYSIKMLIAHLVIDGKESDSFVSWETTSREEFYSALKANPDRFKTSPPSAGEVRDAFRKIVSEGKGVLFLALSSKISGAYEFACEAKAMVLEEMPDAKIEVIDSLRFGPAVGLMAVNASKFRAAGHSLEETAAELEKTKNLYHQAGWLDDLSFVAKKGRINHAAAFFGTLIGIKPIGEFDYNGLTTVIGKAKGEKAAYAALLGYIEKTIVNPEGQVIFIAQSNRRAQAEKYKAMIEEKFHPLEVCVKDVYPTCGINVGPGLMAAYYVGTPISEGLEAEKQILTKCLEG
ncbi:MAG: DegV family protein [Clostridia bacterium]|nr:DegV family protein [Clostridia bacterium]